MFRNIWLLRSQAFMMKCFEVLNLLKSRLHVYSTKIFSVLFLLCSCILYHKVMVIALDIMLELIRNRNISEMLMILVIEVG